MKNRLPFIALAVVVIALITALVVSQRVGKRAGNELSGTIEAYEVQVTSRVSARVLAVRAEEGAQVKAGDTLLLLDDADYRNAALAAQSQLRAAGANRDALAARALLAESSFARMRRLYEAGSLSRQEYDRTQTETKAASEALVAAHTAVEATRAQADIAAARQTDCAIVAPLAGTLATLVFRQGETVVPGSTCATIIDLDQTWLVVYLPERLLGRVKLGDTCRVRVDAYPGKDLQGTISYMADKAEFTPKDIQTREERVNQVYRVKVAIPNPDRILKPGMPADAWLTLH